MTTIAQAAASSPLAPFGVTEASIRTRILEDLSVAGKGFLAVFQEALLVPYDKIPAERRGPATAAAYSWLKAFVGSSAFATAYAATRNARKPPDAPSSSVDDEVRKQIAESIADLEASKEGLAVLPPADRAKAMANVEKMIADLRSPEYAARLRTMAQASRGDQDANAQKLTGDWQSTWPADPHLYIKAGLQGYLAATANVDFVTPTIFVKNDDGTTAGFLRAGMTSIDRVTLIAVVMGKAAVDAARSVIETWLKELP